MLKLKVVYALKTVFLGVQLLVSWWRTKRRIGRVNRKSQSSLESLACVQRELWHPQI